MCDELVAYFFAFPTKGCRVCVEALDIMSVFKAGNRGKAVLCPDSLGKQNLSTKSPANFSFCLLTRTVGMATQRVLGKLAFIWATLKTVEILLGGNKHWVGH